VAERQRGQMRVSRSDNHLSDEPSPTSMPYFVQRTPEGGASRLLPVAGGSRRASGSGR